MTTRNFTAEEKAKLTQLIREGSTVLQEVEDLNGSLSDTIKAVAEEMEIKPSILKKAVTIAHKGDFGKHSDDHSMLENILGAVGKLDTP
jgi:transposase-like protein